MSTPEVDHAFREAWRRLEAAGIESARTDARLLLGLVLGGGSEKVLAEKGRNLSEDEARHFDDVLARRLNREPISHILGTKEFWSLDYKVTTATLTPRPDTETVIDAVLNACTTPPARIVDLGTGTGCILLSLLGEWPDASGVGVDVSEAALEVAQANANALALADRTRFVRADWTVAGWHDALGGPFDVMVSNPPYIPSADIETLQDDVRMFEPHLALDGGLDGLDAYRILVNAAKALLVDDGVLAFEVGIGQSEDVKHIIAGAGLRFVDVVKDLAGIDRAVVARK